MLETDVAPGIHRICHAYTNLYLVEQDAGLVIVDTGLPRVWAELSEAIKRVGRTTDDIHGIVLTHGHFDHVGTARKAVQEWGCPVYIHRDDAYLAAHPYRYRHEVSRISVPLRHPGSWTKLTRMTIAGALQVRGIPSEQLTLFGEHAALPGNPDVILTPGHTAGHVALYFRDRDTVIAGDALVTLDPYTGRTGPQIVAGSATADTTRAADSLAGIAATGARTLLPGHGEPWRRGAASAADEALAVHRKHVG